MPCRSEYMEPNAREIELSKLLALRDELDGKGLSDDFGSGYGPAYNSNITQEELDHLTADLCSRLRRTDVKTYSLEMQMWWRNHQEADRKRVARVRIADRRR